MTTASISPFLINMNFDSFTNNETNNIRLYFARVIDQLAFNAYSKDFDWNSADLFIIMRPNMWDCVSHIYAYGTYYHQGMNMNMCFTDYTKLVRTRHKEHLTKRALPIGGRFYPVVLDSEIPDIIGRGSNACSNIYFITTRVADRTITWGEYQDFNKDATTPWLSGCIQNIRCCIRGKNGQGVRLIAARDGGDE